MATRASESVARKDEILCDMSPVELLHVRCSINGPGEFGQREPEGVHCML